MLSADSQVIKFWDVADTFLSLPFPPCEDVAAYPLSHGLSGAVCSEGQGADAASSVATEVALVYGHG